MSLRPKSTIAEIGNLLVGFNSNIKLGNLDRTSGELLSVTSEINSKQNTLIKLQTEQLDVEERQLSVQKQMLLQQKLQTLIQEQEQLRKRRQRELKRCYLLDKDGDRRCPFQARLAHKVFSFRTSTKRYS